MFLEGTHKIKRQFAGRHNVIGVPYAGGTFPYVWNRFLETYGEDLEGGERRFHWFQFTYGRVLRCESWLFQPTDVTKTENGQLWRLFQEVQASSNDVIIMRPEGYRIWIQDRHYRQMDQLLDKWIAENSIQIVKKLDK